MIARNPTLVQTALLGTHADLSRKVIRGASYTFLGMVTRTLVTLGSVAMLARLLSPRDFGLVAMATIVTELAALFSNFGFGSLLIQRRTATRLQLDTVFWASLGLGFVLSLVVYALSFVSAAFFAEPQTGSVLRVLCWVFVLEELTVVPQALLSRLMRFDAPFYIQFAMILTRAGVAVATAYHGFGVWSLVAGSLSGSLVQAIAYLAAARYWPRLRFHRRFVHANLATSGSYFGGGLLFYVNSNADLLLVGRTLGADALGIYQNARSLTDEIRARIATPLQRVLFPAFSAVQHHPERLRAGILRSGRLVALIVVPIGFGIAAVAHDLVPVLYGERWHEMSRPLQFIAASAAVRAACWMATPVFNATNRVGLAFRVGVVSTMITVIAILTGSHFGLTGVAIAVCAASSTSVVVYGVALATVGLGVRALASLLLGPLLGALAMWALVAFARTLPELAALSPVPRLAIEVVIGTVVYGGAMAALARTHVSDAFAVLRAMLAR
jgi:PST family polysaccharide transporter